MKPKCRKTSSTYCSNYIPVILLNWYDFIQLSADWLFNDWFSISSPSNWNISFSPVSSHKKNTIKTLQFGVQCSIIVCCIWLNYNSIMVSIAQKAHKCVLLFTWWYKLFSMQWRSKHQLIDFKQRMGVKTSRRIFRLARSRIP